MVLGLSLFDPLICFLRIEVTMIELLLQTLAIHLQLLVMRIELHVLGVEYITLLVEFVVGLLQGLYLLIGVGDFSLKLIDALLEFAVDLDELVDLLERFLVASLECIAGDVGKTGKAHRTHRYK